VADEDEDVLRHLEEQLLSASVRRSAERVAALLVDDFVEFGGSGRVFDKAQIVADLAAEPLTMSPVLRSLREFRVRKLAPDVALVTYRAVRSGADGGEAHSLRSSIWTRDAGSWRMVFHQGTPTAAKSKG
jgi:hypothetical protein